MPDEEKKGGLALLIAEDKGPDSDSDDENEGEEYDELSSDLASDVLSAVSAKDETMLASALKNLIMACK